MPFCPILFRRLNKVPEGSLIETHDQSRVIIVIFAHGIIGEQGHVPVAVFLYMQVVQVVGSKIDLGLRISPEVRRELLRGVGYVSLFHVSIDNPSGGSQNLEHPLSWIRMLILQTVQVAEHIAKVGFEISHRKKKKRI